MTRPGRWGLATAVLVGILVVLASGTGSSRSGWTVARVDNPTSTSATGSLAFSHTAGGCAAGPRVTAAVTCTGSPLSGDAVTDRGNLASDALGAAVTVASCAPVQLANFTDAADPLLPHQGVAVSAGDPWGGTHAVALDGTGYAGAVIAQGEPTLARAYGLGIWFRAAPGRSGPLLSFGTNPTAAAGGDRRALALNADGTVSFTYDGFTPRLTTTAGRSYADGTWHFAFVRFTLAALGPSSLTLGVDGGTPVSTSASVTAPGPTGYWRLGWAPTALTGGTATFTGSLSNAVVFYGLVVPSTPAAADLASQTAFTAWAATATEDWVLDDTGTTTYTGTLPGLGLTSPCAYVDIVWSLTGPAGTVAPAGTSLAALADGQPRAVAAPGAGQTQTWTVTLARRSGAPAIEAGLRLYVPVTYLVRAGTWTQAFAWASRDAVVVAP